MAKGEIGGNAREVLCSLFERIEALEGQKAEIADTIKAVLAKAKADGFNPKHIRTTLHRRKQPPQQRQEADTVQALYDKAGGVGDTPPLHRALAAALRDGADNDAIFEILKKLAPASGDIIFRVGGRLMRIFRDGSGEAKVKPWREVPLSQPPSSPPGEGAAPPASAKTLLPEVDAAGAERMGREAFRANLPITSNPFPFGDGRVAAWDRGYRAESGSDGMGS